MFYDNIILLSSFHLNLLLFRSLNVHRVSLLLHSLVNLGFYLPSLAFNNGLNQILQLRAHSHLAQFLCTVPEHDWPSSLSPPTDLHSLCSGRHQAWAAQLHLVHLSSYLSFFWLCCGLFCVVLIENSPLTFLDFLIMHGRLIHIHHVLHRAEAHRSNNLDSGGQTCRVSPPKKSLEPWLSFQRIYPETTCNGLTVNFFFSVSKRWLNVRILYPVAVWGSWRSRCYGSR